MSAELSRRLYDQTFTTAAMRAIFCDRGRVQGMLDFEAALVEAEEEVGLVPPGCATAIGAQCVADRFDIESLALAASEAGNAAIPLVKALTARVAESDADAARYVHWGATSQDAIDTGLVLQLRAAIDLLSTDLDRLADALAKLTRDHRGTVLPARTWLQQALPTTFGLKTAGWLSAVERHRLRLQEARSRVLVLQFGGAAGTLAAMGDRGLAVAGALAKKLHLDLPDLPWHTERDRLAEVATLCGLLVGTLGKIARDVSLLMQTEVAEAAEPTAPGRGSSSTMPHKRNPVLCATVLAAATQIPAQVSIMLAAMGQEHERGLGGWHAEWETLPDICASTAGALAHVIILVEGLEIDALRMRKNLDMTRGLILAEAVTIALGRHLGRLAAHRLVEDACHKSVAQDRALIDVLDNEERVREHLTHDDLVRLLNPENYIGQAQALVERVLAEWAARR